MGLIRHRNLSIHRRHIDDGPRLAGLVAAQEPPNAQPGAHHVDPQMAFKVIHISIDNRTARADTSTVHQAGERPRILQHPIPSRLVSHIQRHHTLSRNHVSRRHIPTLALQYPTSLRSDARCPAGHQHPTRHQWPRYDRTKSWEARNSSDGPLMSLLPVRST